MCLFRKRIASLEEQLAAAEGREGSELELAAARYAPMVSN
jgi:hypothetical protein